MSRILVTNDDGVASPGLGILAARLAVDGHDVFTAAPASEASGSSAAIGAILEGDEINTHLVELADAPGLVAYSVDGPPGRCVLAAILGAFGPPPDIVISGINPGANTGRFLQLHSGTLGAALTASGLGLTAMAVSIGSLKPNHWRTAAEVAARLVAYVSSCQARTVLNLNVPELPFDALRGIRFPELGSVPSKRLGVRGTAPGRLHITWTDNERAAAAVASSDSSLLAAGYVTLTKVLAHTSVTPEPLPDQLTGALATRK